MQKLPVYLNGLNSKLNYYLGGMDWKFVVDSELRGGNKCK